MFEKKKIKFGRKLEFLKNKNKIFPKIENCKKNKFLPKIEIYEKKIKL